MSFARRLVASLSRPKPVVTAAPVDPFDDDVLRRLELLRVVARRVFRGRLRAERKTRKLGSGLEFADHREYSPGDDIRHIDWNVLMRLEIALVRLYEEDEDLPIRILVDVSRSMADGGGHKLVQARRVAAALAYVGLAELDRVGLVCASKEVHATLPPIRGKGRIFRVLDFLREVEVGGATDLRGACARVAAESHQPGLTIVISDFYDPRAFEGLNLLRFRRHEPVAIHVVDPGELTATASWRGDVTLVDVETDEEREVTLSPATVRAYADAHERFCATLAAECRSRAIPYFRADTTTRFDDLVLRMFRDGGLLR